MKTAKFIVVGGGVAGQQFEVTLPATIGRSHNSTVVLTQPLVSRHHCRIEVQGGSLLVEDLGSLNGTYIGNQQIRERSVLEPGGLLTIGTVTLRAVYGNYDPEFTDHDACDDDTTREVKSSEVSDDTVDLRNEGTIIQSARQPTPPPPRTKRTKSIDSRRLS